MTLYRQTISPAGLDLAPARGRARNALDDTVGAAAKGALHELRICEESADLKPAAALAARLRGEAEHVVVLGTGGSSLGAQAVVQLSGFATPLAVLAAKEPRLTFLDNLDGPTLEHLLEGLPLGRTHFLTVSKSGGTAETLMQLLVVVAALEKAGEGKRLADRVSIITEAKPSPLRRLGEARGLTLLEHPNDIGGRFSVLSIVGLLPAMLAGLSAERIRAGAAGVWRAAKSGDGMAAEGAAFQVAGGEAGKAISVLMPYSDRLERFAFWYRQLWAESLGKGGKGTLPVRALGPVDQHSQLQLYLDGPPNALYTIVVETQTGPRVPQALAGGDLAYLGGHAIGDLVAAEARATYETLAGHARPSRLIEIQALDEEILGGLFMHFMLETILTARMIGVNAFDQPAVEEGKILAKRYLGAMPKG